MMIEFGYCLGIENYLCYLLGRILGDLFLILLDYLFDDVLMIIDELYVIVL